LTTILLFNKTAVQLVKSLPCPNKALEINTQKKKMTCNTRMVKDFKHEKMWVISNTTNLGMGILKGVKAG
jgi:hypothetical protein